MLNGLKTLVVLFKTKQNMDKHIKISLKGTELTVNEFIGLEALYSKKQLQVNELSKYLIIPNSSLTYVLDTLEKKGYVFRCAHEKDRRIQSITLTEKGEEVFLKTYKVHYEYMVGLFDVLTKEENLTLQNLLKKLGKHLESEIK